jgi:aspartyl-tRNA(Asn)/glutamyl-tRNA(Gln) amidotransferase subunit C
MVEVDQNLTLRVAKLARLELTPEEVKQFTPQIQQVLSYVDQLSEVNVAGVEPMSTPITSEPFLRPDQVEVFKPDAQGQSKILKHAPSVLNDGFKVPPII